jgi:hypothetical protein
MKVMDFTKDFDEFPEGRRRVGPRGRITTVGEQIMGTGRIRLEGSRKASVGARRDRRP